MRRLARENASCALMALAGCAALAWLGLYGFAWNDYETRRARHSRRSCTATSAQFLRLAPAYGGSLVERAPFALIPILWGGGELAVYRMVAMPCLLAAALLGVWLVARMRGRSATGAGTARSRSRCASPTRSRCARSKSATPRSCWAPACASPRCCSPAKDAALWAGLLLGLAIANKEWALLAAGPVLLALPRASQAGVRARSPPRSPPPCSRRWR